MNIIFDTIIAVFLLTDGVVLIWFGWRWRKLAVSGRTAWPTAVICVVLLFSWAVIFYGSFIEPRLLVVHNQEIVIGGNPTEELRAVLISDLHVGPYKKADWVEKVVKKIVELSPDVIFLAGDFVYDDASQAEFLEPLRELKAPLGIFAVLGNHDYDSGGEKEVAAATEERASTIKEKLESLGITVLKNQTRNIQKGEKKLLLLGVNEFWSSETLGVSGTLETSPHYENKPWPESHAGFLILSHNPDIVVEANDVIPQNGIVLAAHTHGGQIRLPFLGSVPQIPTHLGNSYDRGLFQYKNTQLFITSGAGEMGPRARLLVPPEIALLKIRF